ncbi:MAG: VOC family protein, partial [Delftia acidovorans]|nr:VOC family protein [Delftia acidovorans]
GSSIAFFECPRDPGQMKDMESPGWIQHFAFEVADVDTVLRARQDLLDRGIDVVGPTNHDDFITSIYFFDPSGHRLELTARTADAARHQVFEREAMQVLALWNETHDWSQREKLYGAQTGYARADR